MGVSSNVIVELLELDNTKPLIISLTENGITHMGHIVALNDGQIDALSWTDPADGNKKPVFLGPKLNLKMLKAFYFAQCEIIDGIQDWKHLCPDDFDQWQVTEFDATKVYKPWVRPGTATSATGTGTTAGTGCAR